MDDSSTITHVLTRGDTVGLTLAAASAFLSLTSITVMFLIMFWNIYQEIKAHPGSWTFIRRPIDLYILALLLADVVQSLGHILSIRWISSGIVVEGLYCTVQGITQQLGETAVAMTTLAIALHTFVVVWWRRGSTALVTARVVVVTIWIYIISFVAIGNGIFAKREYIIPDPFWCWIAPHYTVQQILGEYIWLWLACILSFLIYIPLFFCSRGNIVVSSEAWWKFKWRHVESPRPGHLQAIGLLAYPLVYAVLVSPLSGVRWKLFYQTNHGRPASVPPAATLSVNAIFELSGAVNVLLLLATRPDVLLFRREEQHPGQLPHLLPPNVNGLPLGPVLPQTCPHCRVDLTAAPASAPPAVGDGDRATSSSPGPAASSPVV